MWHHCYSVIPGWNQHNHRSCPWLERSRCRCAKTCTWRRRQCVGCRSRQVSSAGIVCPSHRWRGRHSYTHLSGTWSRHTEPPHTRWWISSDKAWNKTHLETCSLYWQPDPCQLSPILTLTLWLGYDLWPFDLRINAPQGPAMPRLDVSSSSSLFPFRVRTNKDRQTRNMDTTECLIPVGSYTASLDNVLVLFNLPTIPYSSQVRLRLGIARVLSKHLELQRNLLQARCNSRRQTNSVVAQKAIIKNSQLNTPRGWEDEEDQSVKLFLQTWSYHGKWCIWKAPELSFWGGHFRAR